MGPPLPLFAGTLSERWSPFEDRLHIWLRLNRIDSDAMMRDTLSFAFPLGSAAASYMQLVPSQLGFHETLGLMRARFNSDIRQRSIVQAARNSLDLRRFRDDRHRSEMCSDVVDELVVQFELARVTADGERKSYLQRAFQRFLLAERLVYKALTFDDAVLRLLHWEQQIVSLQADNATMPMLPAHTSTESLADPQLDYRNGPSKPPGLSVIAASPDRPTQRLSEDRSTDTELESPKFPLPPAAMRPATSANFRAVRRQRSQSLDESRLERSPSTPEFGSPVRRSNSVTATALPRTPEIGRESFNRSQPAQPIPQSNLNRSSSTLRRFIPSIRSKGKSSAR